MDGLIPEDIGAMIFTLVLVAFCIVLGVIGGRNRALARRIGTGVFFLAALIAGMVVAFIEGACWPIGYGFLGGVVLAAIYFGMDSTNEKLTEEMQQRWLKDR
jgi:hypothetical protein